jgi:hypothetical protein
MWCHNDKNNFMSSIEGQLNEHTIAGQLIINVIKYNNLKNILDIGTWNGLGSTKCILLGIENNINQNQPPKLISIESNKDKNMIAKNNLKYFLENNENNIQLLHGSILQKSDIHDIDTIFPELLNNSEFIRWHNIDIINIENSPYLYNSIPNELDFVLFDGGEFTTYYEFEKLFPRCTKFIALDDVNVSKCIKIRSYLNSHPQWTELNYINERNGFSLFIKK